MNDAPRYSTLRDYLHLLRKQWLLILVPMIVGAAAAYYFSNRDHKVYKTTAAVSIQDETQILQLLGAQSSQGSATNNSAVVVAQTIDTPQLARRVRHRMKTHIDPGALQGMVSLGVDAASGLVIVTSSTENAGLAADVANAYASQIADDTTADARHQFSSAIDSLQGRLKKLSPKDPATVGERADLQTEITRLQFLHSNSTPGQVARSAQAPASPVSPKPTREAALGLGAGLLVGLILAFLRESLDRRLRGAGEIQAELGYRVIGQLRDQTLGQAVKPSSVMERDQAGDVETFRILRRNVDFLAPGPEGRVILVTSALPEEGKSTVAASLALAAAASGRRTLLIEADLRRPALAGRLEIKPAPGLSEYLAGRAEPHDVLQTIPVAAPESAANGNSAADPDNVLVCVPAGAVSSRSAELLSSNRMASLLREVRQVYDLVLVDSAPLLPVADTLELLPHVAGVVFCVRSGRTTRDQARAAKAALSAVPPDSIGIVVTGLQRRDEPAGYGLYPYYYSEAERIEA
jgi:capsular exopolysaccharide synthesis family protein